MRLSATDEKVDLALVENRAPSVGHMFRDRVAALPDGEAFRHPVGEGWAHTQVRYYVYAFLYVIFAVDSIFLFPWATVFAAPGYGATTLVEMFIFLGFLAVGLLYAYKKGVLAWT